MKVRISVVLLHQYNEADSPERRAITNPRQYRALQIAIYLLNSDGQGADHINEVTMKDSFIMQTKYEKHFRRLGEKRGYMLLMAIFEYEQTRIIPELNESIEDAFYFIKDDLDKAYDNYQKAVDRNKANGSKGGRPKTEKTQENRKNPVGFGKPKKADSECGSDSDISADADISARARGEQPQREYIRFYSDNIGIITPSTVKEAESFIEDDGMEDAVIVMAMKEAVDADVKNWRYAKKVLSSWLERGVKTAEQAKAAKTEFKNRVRGKPKDTAERSYTAEQKKERERAAYADMEELANGI